jgi:subtilisin-like proprotein convertase family protein
MPRATMHAGLVLGLFSAFAAHAAVNTYSTSPSLVVPDVSTVTSTINVPDTGTVNSITVTLTLEHPQIADVRISLTDPSGSVTKTIFNRLSGVADGIYNVTFTDAAGGPPPFFLTNGQCLTNTSYQPAEPLSGFAGVQIVGNWTLTVADLAGSDSVDCDCDPINVGPPCPRTLDSWSMTINYSTNRPPVAVCHSVTVNADAGACTAAASIDGGSTDPDGDSLTMSQNPPGPYPLGTTPVTLTATDSHGESDSCSATVTVVDNTPPVVACNAPASITPPQAPISFTASAADACGSTTIAVQSYDCFTFTNKGKRIDKRDSCVVSFSGATLTIINSGGVGDIIQWTVAAHDGSGNSTQTTCTAHVLNPGH